MAAVHQATGSALAMSPTTGIACGVYRFPTHAAMNRHSEEAQARALALNARLRAMAAR
jgi:ribose 5-phosphate isomerase RpiB